MCLDVVCVEGGFSQKWSELCFMGIVMQKSRLKINYKEERRSAENFKDLRKNSLSTDSILRSNLEHMLIIINICGNYEYINL